MRPCSRKLCDCPEIEHLVVTSLKSRLRCSMLGSLLSLDSLFEKMRTLASRAQVSLVFRCLSDQRAVSLQIWRSDTYFGPDGQWHAVSEELGSPGQNSSSTGRGVPTPDSRRLCLPGRIWPSVRRRSLVPARGFKQSQQWQHLIWLHQSRRRCHAS